MAVKEAEAHIEITPEALGQVLRRRAVEGHIEVDSLPGVNADPGKEYEIKCESMEELQEFLVAMQNDEDVSEWIRGE